MFRYVAALIELTPMLSPLLRSWTADQLELATGVVIEIRAASFRGLRGVTCVAVVADEICYWLGEDRFEQPRRRDFERAAAELGDDERADDCDLDAVCSEGCGV